MLGQIIKRLIHLFKFGFKYIKTSKFRKKEERISRGEAMIKSFLTYCDVILKCQYYVKVPASIRKSKRAFIDFMVWKNGKQYAIEYNGRQHYEFVPYFHKSIDEYRAQVNRDWYIRQWCLEHNIEFIEIPYYWSDTRILNYLNKLFG